MNIKKIVFSAFLIASATPVFATELRSIQLDDYNCEESSDIAVKACLETTLSRSVANLSETEHHFKKAIEDNSNISVEAANILKNIFNEEKAAYTAYSEKQCNFKVAIESQQNPDAKLEKLSLICQINAIDNRIEKITEFTHDIVNDYVANKTASDESNNDLSAPADDAVEESTTEYLNPENASMEEVTEPSEVVEPTNDVDTTIIESTDATVPDTESDSESDIENDI